MDQLVAHEFLQVPPTTVRGSVMKPVNADAATVAAEPSQISASSFESRPLKFRLAVDITVSRSPGTR